MLSTTVASGLALLLAASIAASSAHARDKRQLRCESVDQQPQRCAADTRNGVRLAKQLSRAQCAEGRSWGSDGDGIWVKDGCRGDFVLGVGSSGRSGYAAQVVRCDSIGNRWEHCDANTAEGVDIVRQRSDKPCIRGQSWGTDERGVWVSGGCRADFRPRTRPEVDTGEPMVRVVRCESRDGRTAQCALEGKPSVRLRRQLSKAECVEDRSWGSDKDGIWVSRGCRAEFELLARD